MSDRPILFSAPMVTAILSGTKTQTRRLFKPMPPAWANHCEEVQRFNMRQEWVPAGLWWWTETDATGQLALRRWPVDEYGRRYALRPAFARRDRLWVRETWRTASVLDDVSPAKLKSTETRDVPYTPIRYDADGAPVDFHPLSDPDFGRVRSAIHMPHWASRLTLVVTDIRVQRLQEISEEDAVAEGIETDLWDMAPVARRYGTEGWFVGWSLGIEEPSVSVDPDEVCRHSFASLWDSINGKRPGASWADNPWVAAITFEAHRCNIDALPASPAHEVAA